MLETIRAFVAERLAAAPRRRRRPAPPRRALPRAGRAGRPAAAGIGQSEWVERLGRGGQPGRRRALVPDPRPRAAAPPVPHPGAVLGPARPVGRAALWIDQLLPDADSLDPQARAELLWTAADVRARAGRRRGGAGGRERLTPLLDEIDDAYLDALSATWPWRGPRRSSATTTRRSDRHRSARAAPRPGRAVLDGVALVTAGAWSRASAATTTRAPPERGARPRRAIGQRLAGRLVAGEPGERRRHARPVRRRPGAARRGAGPEPGAPQHPLLTLCLDASPAWRSRRATRTGGAAGRGGRGPAPAGRLAGLADAARYRGRADGPGPRGAGHRPLRPGVRRRLGPQRSGSSGSRRPDS